VELCDVALNVGELGLLGSLLLLGVLNGHVEVSLGSLLAGDALDVLGAAGLRISHEALVVGLGCLFFVLGGGHVVVELLGEHLHEANDTIALLALLLVRTPGLWWWWWGSVVTDLHLDVDSSLVVGGGSGGFFGDTWIDTTAGNNELLLIIELTLWCCLVEIWAVELEETVLGLLDQLDSGVGLAGELSEFCMLGLELSGRVSNGLVESLDLPLQVGHLIGSCGAGGGSLFDGSLT